MDPKSTTARYNHVMTVCGEFMQAGGDLSVADALHFMAIIGR
jgi:hypothetical protein